MVFCCKIIIGKFVFTSASEIEIIKTWKKFTDTAIIKIPRNIHLKKDGNLTKLDDLRDFVKVGDKVKIELGYNRQLQTEFEGYVSRSPIMDVPYIIECEDEMWQLKQKEVSVSIEDATVKQIIQEAAPNYDIDCVDEIFGDFSMVETTPVKIFDELRKRAGLYTFFRGKRLVCGLIYSDQKVSEIVPNYVVGKNIISSSLQFKSGADTKIKVFAFSSQDDGNIIRVELGELGGNIERWKMPRNQTKKELELLILRRMETIKKTGSTNGNFLTFGSPIIEHGQVLRYYDMMKEKIDTKLYVDEININVSMDGGYRKTIHPGKKYTELK